MTMPGKNPFPFAESIGAQVRDERTSRRLSDSKLAKSAGVSRRHLVELQKGANVTLSIVQKVMMALELRELSFGPVQRLTVPPTEVNAAAHRQQIATATQQIETGVALLLHGAAALRPTIPVASATSPTSATVSSELAAKAGSLIDEFGAYVRSLDSTDQVDALQRLASTLLLPPVRARKRKAKTA